MVEHPKEYSFSELVAQRLSPEARELWIPLADEFDRNGPEAAAIYLETEKQQLEDRVRDLLDQFGGS